jgi:hypothetical protein
LGAAKDPKNAKATFKKAMALLNDGVCVKECPKKDSPKVDCKSTKAMLAMTKTIKGEAQ